LLYFSIEVDGFIDDLDRLYDFFVNEAELLFYFFSPSDIGDLSEFILELG